VRPAPDIQLETNACGTLLGIWAAARGDNILPRRADIDPGAFKAIMPQVAIVAVPAPGINEIRLAGTAYRDIFGFETTSQNLIDISVPEVRRVRAYRFWTGVTHPCAGWAVLSFPYAQGTSDRFEFLALPLEANAADQPRMMLCAIGSILGRQWKNERPAQAIAGPAETFSFVDIGAGVPPSLDPPVDFALES
jgi:hypothetical protein